MAATHQLALTFCLPKGQRPGFSALTHECCLEHTALLKRQQVKNFIKRHEKVMRQQCVPSLPSNCFRLWGVKITVYTVYIWSAVKRQLFSQTWRGQTFSLVISLAEARREVVQGPSVRSSHRPTLDCWRMLVHLDNLSWLWGLHCKQQFSFSFQPHVVQQCSATVCNKQGQCWREAKSGNEHTCVTLVRRPITSGDKTLLHE